jgi:RimJ/RimL family protein N-acetyltransferase
MNAVVQRLTQLQQPELLSHLLTLSPADRRLRFGSTMHNEALERYVKGIDFARDKVFGILGNDMSLVGAAHLALDRARGCAELGLSVEPLQRGKGHGLTLLMRAKLHAMNLGYTTLFMHCLSENQIMVHLARKAGLKLVTDRGEVDAHLELDATSYGAVAREAVEDQMALVDLMCKQQFQWLFKRPNAA